MNIKKANNKEQLLIAIHPDNCTANNTNPRYIDSFFTSWAKLFTKKGHKIKIVDVRSTSALHDIHKCDAFMWRWRHMGGDSNIAKNLLPVLENVFNIPVFPNQHTCWHYDNKIAQSYLFIAHSIPHPSTFIWYDEQRATHWALNSATYPLVLKLSSGAGSTNVLKINNANEALRWIIILSRQGTFSLNPRNRTRQELEQTIQQYANCIAATGFPPNPGDYYYEYHKGYILFQKFLPNNNFDTRVTVIGKRAFAFRRINREGDFRASGSGNIDYNICKIDLNFIHLAFEIATKLKTQSIAIDGIYDENRPVAIEISYTYASWAVKNCPGHWELTGSPWSGELKFIPGCMCPGHAQAEDFLEYIKSAKN